MYHKKLTILFVRVTLAELVRADGRVLPILYNDRLCDAQQGNGYAGEMMAALIRQTSVSWKIFIKESSFIQKCVQSPYFLQYLTYHCWSSEALTSLSIYVFVCNAKHYCLQRRIILQQHDFHAIFKISLSAVEKTFWLTNSSLF